MKTNKEIISQYSHHEIEVTEVDGDVLTEGIYIGCALHAMKEAQVEALKELVKRKWESSISAFRGTAFKSIDDIALELIKEIES